MIGGAVVVIGEPVPFFTGVLRSEENARPVPRQGCGGGRIPAEQPATSPSAAEFPAPCRGVRLSPLPSALWSSDAETRREPHFMTPMTMSTSSRIRITVLDRSAVGHGDGRNDPRRA